jgi:hypothetical protein
MNLREMLQCGRYSSVDCVALGQIPGQDGFTGWKFYGTGRPAPCVPAARAER